MSYNEFKYYTPKHFRLYVEAYYERKASELDADNMRIGKLCSVICNLVSKRKFKPSDFFKKVSKPKQMSVDQMANIFKSITKAMGGTVNE